MKLENFDYSLPASAIAQTPMEPRDQARMLVISPDGTLSHQIVAELPQFLRQGDIMVFNDTRVIAARLLGTRARRVPNRQKKTIINGKAIINRDEVLPLVEITVNLLQRVSSPNLHPNEKPPPDEQNWRILAKPGKRLTLGDWIEFADDFKARLVTRNEPEGLILAFPYPESEFNLKLAQYGQVPIPPYLKRQPVASDSEQYQTIFARNPGAVAAPTAGLHFTPRLLEALQNQKIETAFVTLHVSGGTFLPITVSDTNDHVMHKEWAELTHETAEKLNRIRRNGGRIIACGTTSLRVLESAVNDQGIFLPIKNETKLFIQPGYKFRAIDILLTNFHVPKSTLLVLVSAWIGRERILDAYRIALEQGYRFFSYGDCCLLFPPNGIARALPEPSRALPCTRQG